MRPSGKEIDAKEAAPKKAPKPMDARLFGRATESRVLQLEKAKSPMEVRLSGSATESRVLQPKKAQTAVVDRGEALGQDEVGVPHAVVVVPVALLLAETETPAA